MLPDKFIRRIGFQFGVGLIGSMLCFIGIIRGLKWIYAHIL